MQNKKPYAALDDGDRLRNDLAAAIARAVSAERRDVGLNARVDGLESLLSTERAKRDEAEREPPVTATRIEREPSNSKCPGATRHVSIGDEKFRAAPEDRGTGLARVEIPAGPSIIRIGGTFTRASGKGDRRQVEIPVVVTGVETDTVLGVLDGGSQSFEIRFSGVRKVEG